MNPPRSFSASTLSELLIVMVLIGIVLLSVWEGFTLFQRLQRRTQEKLERSLAQADCLFRLESLFKNSDSLREEPDRLELYRQGEMREYLRVKDSVLTVFRTAEGIAPDTLLRGITQCRIVSHPDFPQRIDSLLLTVDSVVLKLGMGPRLEEEALRQAMQLERNYAEDEDY
ncbi:MAG: type II secretion system GspH family protein [Rikenellaceae bacterium]|nr:type II secretion system GspH family protein [Rikenellaceae bacterium]